jgi:hypothetical protein
MMIHFIITLPYMPRSSKWPLSVSFPHRLLYAPLLYFTRATYPALLILVDLITRIIFGEYRNLLNVQSSLLPCYLAPLRPKYLPQHTSLKILNLHFSINATEQVSHPYKTTGKIMVLYILIFIEVGIIAR